jgi:hypothetical protein
VVNDVTYPNDNNSDGDDNNHDDCNNTNNNNSNNNNNNCCVGSWWCVKDTFKCLKLLNLNNKIQNQKCCYQAILADISVSSIVDVNNICA